MSANVILQWMMAFAPFTANECGKYVNRVLGVVRSIHLVTAHTVGYATSTKGACSRRTHESTVDSGEGPKNR